MGAFQSLTEALRSQPGTWLVTGSAGFIGSNLVEALLRLDQRVVGLDNFATGSSRNLDEVRDLVGAARWKNFTFIEGDIRNEAACGRACAGVDYVLHQAALGSVPRSIEKPTESHASNVTGFINVLLAARDQHVKRVVYASSSSVYGDDPHLPKVEEKIGRCLSPYAATKRANELYADAFARCYGLELVGLRYFNVFGPRQDPEGPYAAVIPRWISALLKHEPIFINGDGTTSRDFCYVANAVQANLLAATTTAAEAINQIYNIAVGDRTSLNLLFDHLRDRLMLLHPGLKDYRPVYRDFRPGDILHSEADISKARRLLGYEPTHEVEDGLKEALNWYENHLS